MEQSKLWRNNDFKGIELLSATYTTFEFKKHWHDELAIGVIESGAERVWYRGQNLLVPQKQIIAINPSEVHTGLAGIESGWRYRMFYFDMEYLSSYFKDSLFNINCVIDSPIIDDAGLYQDLLSLHYAMEKSSLTLSKDSLFTLAIERLFTQYGSIPDFELAKKTNSKCAQMVREFILDDWQGNPSLKALEHHTKCTRFQILRSFKAKFGITPHQFLLLIKTQKAKQMLAHGTSYIETSLACGFYDQSHFNRNFRKVYGIKPSHYSPAHTT